jgi:hypothetical protein
VDDVHVVGPDELLDGVRRSLGLQALGGCDGQVRRSVGDQGDDAPGGTHGACMHLADEPGTYDARAQAIGHSVTLPWWRVSVADGFFRHRIGSYEQNFVMYLGI